MVRVKYYQALFLLQKRMAGRPLSVKKKKYPGNIIPGETDGCPEANGYGAVKAKKDLVVFKSRVSLEGKSII